jgi:Fe(3+) dicitrate transport protein
LVKLFLQTWNYKFNDKTSLHFDYALQLAQQAGGLTDVMFNENQDNRATEREAGLLLTGIYLL